MRSIFVLLTLFIISGSCLESLTKEENEELNKVNSIIRGYAGLISPKFHVVGLASLQSVQPKKLVQVLMQRQELIFKSKNVVEMMLIMDKNFLFKGCSGTLDRVQAVKNALSNTIPRTRVLKNGRFHENGNTVIGEFDYVQKFEGETTETVYPMEYHWKYLENGEFVGIWTEVMDCVGVERDIEKKSWLI